MPDNDKKYATSDKKSSNIEKSIIYQDQNIIDSNSKDQISQFLTFLSRRNKERIYSGMVILS